MESDVGYREIGTLVKKGGDQGDDIRDTMADYFNLHVPLTQLSTQWSRNDPLYKKWSRVIPGARMLRQDPFECLFSFICSQNNHISRIHSMVNALCRMYGTPIPLTEPLCTEMCEYDGKQSLDIFYSFPTLEQLSRATEDELREAGFGYRAKFIVGSVQNLQQKPEGGIEWLMKLRQASFDDCINELCTLPGVGPKVAACVALFSLDKHGSIPVDTHVWQFSNRHYTPHLKGKPPSPKYHPEVQQAFVERFGEYAGWAHNTLFISELASVKKKLRDVEDNSDNEELDEASSATSSDLKSIKSDPDFTPFTPPKEESNNPRKRSAKRMKVKEEEDA